LQRLDLEVILEFRTSVGLKGADFRELEAVFLLGEVFELCEEGFYLVLECDQPLDVKIAPTLL